MIVILTFYIWLYYFAYILIVISCFQIIELVKKGRPTKRT